MQKHKIIHVIYAGLGGHANVLFPLLASDFGEKHEHLVVFFGVEKTLPDYLLKCEELGIRTFSIQKKPRKYLNAFKQFKSILKTESPSRIIVHSSELIIPAVRYCQTKPNTKAFYVEHENNHSKGRSLKLLSKYALRKANGVVCLNENYATELKEQYRCKVPLHIIPNGIDTKKYAPSVEKKEEPIVLGMASRMILGKDHPILLEAFKKVLLNYPNLTLLIAGEGETEEDIKALSAALQLEKNVQFLGLLDESEMLDFYKKINIYILATSAETMSTGILQAMACALPVLTSDIPNNQLLIKPKQTGWLYENKNSLALAQELEKIIENLPVANSIGKQARAAVQNNYSIAMNAKKYEQLIQ